MHRAILKFIFLALMLGLTLPAWSNQEHLELIGGLEKPYPAPLIIGISAWINSSPIKQSDMKNKVVLIEFWTSSCRYCRQALPYTIDWYDRYHNQGLLIIGIHSPKNEEEQNLTLVKDAVAAHKIPYPVALDNHFESWESFYANGWPSFYLIDKKGYVVYTSYGAENFEIIENNIRFLLGQK